MTVNKSDIMNMNDENYKEGQLRDYINRLTEEDCCNECNEKKKIVCCDKCGNAVCTNNRCTVMFPHYKGGVYAVCTSCKTQIEGKLKIFIDLDKLKLLKRKIRKRLQKTN
jgi:hypothetical protein